MSIVEECLLESIAESHILNVSDFVPKISAAPSPFEFYKRWVARNSPFILEGGASHWPAVKKWSNSYLREKMHGKMVTVAVTPNGYADAVCEDRFVMPEERNMTFDSFLDIIEKRVAEQGVHYIQKQNSNLISEFSELWKDIELDVPWATSAFGAQPDAVNFWMGQKEAITSLHKDHYENLYVVIKGEKEFILHPPCDRPFISHKTYLPAKYNKSTDGWSLEDIPNSRSVPWIPVDPLNPDYKTYPMYRNCKLVKCTVKAGDIFYLPSLWFHHVTQTDCTVAVNYWYDMEFDTKYSFYKTLEKLSTDVLGR